MMTVWLMAFNAAFTERKIPPEWRTAEIIMLHKGGEHDNPNFYRLISLIPTTRKVLHMVIAQRLLRYSLKHRLIEREQIGYLSCEETSHSYDHPDGGSGAPNAREEYSPR